MKINIAKHRTVIIYSVEYYSPRPLIGPLPSGENGKPRAPARNLSAPLAVAHRQTLLAARPTRRRNGFRITSSGGSRPSGRYRAAGLDGGHQQFQAESGPDQRNAHTHQAEPLYLHCMVWARHVYQGAISRCGMMLTISGGFQ